MTFGHPRLEGGRGDAYLMPLSEAYDLSLKNFVDPIDRPLSALRLRFLIFEQTLQPLPLSYWLTTRTWIANVVELTSHIAAVAFILRYTHI